MNQTNPTALADAFGKAGYQAPTDRLRICALIAAQASTNWDGKKDALYALVRHDAEMLWEMFASDRAKAAHALLTEAADEIHTSRRVQETAAASSAPGQSANANPRSTARRAPDISSGERGQSTSEHHVWSAPPSRSTATMVDAMVARAAVVQQSLLDTYKLDGKPIGDCTPTMANHWALKHERDARFIRLLTAGLPEDTPIRVHRRAEDTQRLYDAAMRGSTVAA